MLGFAAKYSVPSFLVELRVSERIIPPQKKAQLYMRRLIALISS
jgi:hypothetical protein